MHLSLRMGPSRVISSRAVGAPWRKTGCPYFDPGGLQFKKNGRRAVYKACSDNAVNNKEEK